MNPIERTPSSPSHLVSETNTTSFRRVDLAQFVETQALHQARSRLMTMDPSIQSFLERLETTLKEHTATIQASTAEVDDLVAWHPDLARRVADLTDSVASLQFAPPPPPPSRSEGGPHHAPVLSQQPPATTGTHIGAELGAAATTQGPDGHGVFNITRGRPRRPS